MMMVMMFSVHCNYVFRFRDIATISFFLSIISYDTIRYDTRCYFNVRSKADIGRLNLPHGNDN